MIGSSTNTVASDSPSPAAGGIVVRGVRKRFRQLEVLRGVDLEVERGEVVALLGANGAGKSTLVRILATLVLPDAGDVRVAGFDVRHEARQVRGRIGLVLPDERGWAWRLSGRQNLEFFARMHNLPGRLVPEAVDDALRVAGLGDEADRRFDGYSAGMRAKLGLARAMLGHPAVLLLDEPTRSLDPIAAVDFRTVLAERVRSERDAVLLVTHDLEEASQLADRVVLMSGGRVVRTLASDASAATLREAFAELTMR